MTGCWKDAPLFVVGPARSLAFTDNNHLWLPFAVSGIRNNHFYSEDYRFFWRAVRGWLDRLLVRLLTTDFSPRQHHEVVAVIVNTGDGR